MTDHDYPFHLGLGQIESGFASVQCYGSKERHCSK